MIKVEIFGYSKAADFENALNRFIADKKVIDIKYQALVVPTSFYSGTPTNINVYDRALVIYEED